MVVSLDKGQLTVGFRGVVKVVPKVMLLKYLRSSSKRW